MENKRKERNKFERMARERGSYRISGIDMPAALRESLQKSESGTVPNAAINIFLKKSKRNALNRLSRQLDAKLNVVVRALINSAVTLGPKGTLVFVAAANKIELKKARDKKKRQGVLNDEPEEEEAEDGDEFRYGDDSESETDGNGDERRLRRTDRRKKNRTGTPEPGGGAM